MVMPLKYKKGSVYRGKYGDFEIIEYNSKQDIVVMFLNTGYIKSTQSSSILKGTVKDPYFKNIFDVGCVGETTTSLDGVVKTSYHTWRDMIRRCYDTFTILKNPAYVGVTVCEDWLCFSNYELWYDINYIPNFQIDKDLTIIGNRVYRPEACCFLPRRLNCIIGAKSYSGKVLPTGVSLHKRDGVFNAKCWDGYRLVHLGDFSCANDAQEAYIVYKTNLVRSVADEYYKDGIINKVVYNNLCKFIF